jgi:hypothetical protein
MTHKTAVCAAPRCPRAGLPFEPSRASQRTCSPACRKRLQRSEGKSHKHPGPLTHGASSSDTAAVAARAKTVLARIEPALPSWTSKPEFQPLVVLLARTLAREELLTEYLTRVTLEHGADRVPLRLWETVNATTRTAAGLLTQLGMNPRSFAELRRTTLESESVQETLEQMAARGRKQMIERGFMTEDE